MTLVAGVVHWNGRPRHSVDCSAILSRLNVAGGQSPQTAELGLASFGRLLHCAVPEDQFDRQPLRSQDGRFILCGDIRIDNREEVAQHLPAPPSGWGKTSDSGLFLAAWTKWQRGCFERILGDFALAVWDDNERRLTLARSASSLKPLVYFADSKFVAFASLPQGLMALDGVGTSPDLDEAAAVFAGFPGRNSATVFANVRSVRHSHVVEITCDQVRETRHWFPEGIERRDTPLADSAEALRFELDRAVAACLRRSKGLVASQLSSGRDSTAVTASAALALGKSGEGLLAVTGCPNEAFAGPHTRGRLSDESKLAALVAEKYPNITHVPCRSRPRDLAVEIERLARVHFRPMTNPTALHWSTEVDEQAARRNASVMLNGSTGNFSISASGPAHLIDILRMDGSIAWLRHAIRTAGRSAESWRSIARLSLGPFLPTWAFAGILRATGRDPHEGMTFPLLREPYRRHAETVVREAYADIRPPRNYQQLRCDLLLLRENADLSSSALSGLDVRDPTADRQLVEFCLAFPPGHLVSRRFEPSSVYRAAFGERIPGQVLANRRRGLQGADWFMLFSRSELERCMAAYRQSPAVAELFDLAEIDRLLAHWPDRGSVDWQTIMQFRYQLVSAIAVAGYLSFHFPG